MLLVHQSRMHGGGNGGGRRRRQSTACGPGPALTAAATASWSLRDTRVRSNELMTALYCIAAHCAPALDAAACRTMAAAGGGQTPASRHTAHVVATCSTLLEHAWRVGSNKDVVCIKHMAERMLGCAAAVSTGSGGRSSGSRRSGAQRPAGRLLKRRYSQRSCGSTNPGQHGARKSAERALGFTIPAISPEKAPPPRAVRN